MDTPTDRRTVAKSIAGFVVAGAVLALFVGAVGWRDVARTLAGGDPRYLLAACVSTTLCLAVWARSWDVILDVVDVSIPFGEVVVTYFAATFADYVTPFGKAGGGPFVAYVLSTDDRASFEDSLASVVTADTLNLVPFFTFAGAGLAALAVRGRIPAGADSLVAGLGVLVVGLPILGGVVWFRRDAVEDAVSSLVSPVARRVPRVDAGGIRERVREFYGLLDRIADDPRALAATLAFAFVGWVLFAAPLYLAGLAVGVDLSPLVVLFVVPASSLASFVPTPGGLGGVEAALTGLLVALAGLSPAVAAAVALVYRVASYWYVVGVGGAATLVQVSRV